MNKSSPYSHKQPTIFIKKNVFSPIFFFLLIANIVSCSKDQAAEPQPEPPDSNEVTVENVSYNNFAGALFESKCSSCHAPGRGASGRWTFDGYSSVINNASRINNAVLVTRVMPVGGSLTARERELLQAWFDRSNPEN